MKIIALVVIGLIFAAVATYYLLFPKNSFYIFTLHNGATITFSRTGVSFESAPDHYSVDGIDQVDSYIPKLLEPSRKFKYLHMFTPDGDRGFGLSVRNGIVEASLSLDAREETARESMVRQFFRELGIEPSRDYLSANGGVPDATRHLSYPLTADVHEITEVTKQVLQKLCSISPSEALNVKYGEM